MTNATDPPRNEVRFAPTFIHRLFFTDDVLGPDQGLLAQVLEPSGEGPARVQFWVDEFVAEAQPRLRGALEAFARTHDGRVALAGNVQIVAGGEAVKNDIHILERMLKVFHASGLDRRSYVVVIGGGAVLDAVGFAAAIAHRGLRLVRLPTTTLGQADSGVGVKNAVNLFGKKNWLGSFAVPWAVINDTKLLATLSDRDFIGGFSEAVKVSLLKDPAMFAELCRSAARVRRRDLSAALPIIRDSAEWHRRHITQGGDPFEADEARPLDFGHWSAHRLEAMTDFRLRHGEAVAIGVALDTVYSSMAHGLPWDVAETVVPLPDRPRLQPRPPGPGRRPGLACGARRVPTASRRSPDGDDAPRRRRPDRRPRDRPGLDANGPRMAPVSCPCPEHRRRHPPRRSRSGRGVGYVAAADRGAILIDDARASSGWVSGVSARDPRAWAIVLSRGLVPRPQPPGNAHWDGILGRFLKP